MNTYWQEIIVLKEAYIQIKKELIRLSEKHNIPYYEVETDLNRKLTDNSYNIQGAYYE